MGAKNSLYSESYSYGLYHMSIELRNFYTGLGKVYKNASGSLSCIFPKAFSFTKYLTCFLLLILTIQGTRGQSFQWKNAIPEDLGFSSLKLNEMRDTLAEHSTSSILVIKDDRIVLEWYAPGWGPEKPHGTASLAKALVGGMSLMLALDDGRMKADDFASKFVPEWQNDPLKSKITIRQLATHSSGVENAEITDADIAEAKARGIVMKDKHMDIPGWKGNFWRKDPDPFTMARDYAPVIFTPGTSYHYSNTGMAMLAYAVTASYKGTGVKDIRSLLSDRIMEPIGINENEWSVGYGKTYNVNGLDLVANWGGASFTPRAAARIGRLMMNKGNWEGKQLVSSKLTEEVVKYAGTPLPPRDAKNIAQASGLAWYSNFDGAWERAPRDLFSGAGAGNQTLLVIPSMNIIVVRNGGDMFDPNKGEGFNYGVVNYLINQLMEAYIEPPYPMSDLISEVKFAPVSSVVRKADNCDNWPMTWADDDNQYTAYGDGWGFDPKVEKKLSLGLVKIVGDPEDFQGINIRSESGEQVGQGRYGKKASGMLMVKGILYMFMRNANMNGEESQLAYSSDHGINWEFCDWKFTESYGLPGFINYGRNYKGARDNYVYIHSPDDKDAYLPTDRMVMARVPKNDITDKTAYEYFVSVDDKGEPVWSKDIADRGTVFSHPAMCYRGGMTYNAGLKRYLWCQIHPDSNHSQGPRFQGGFGIYEAPEPWGPWKTVFYTRDWDIGPGESSSFPTKWMSKDGKTCFLVFSGNDYFSVRKVEFVTK